MPSSLVFLCWWKTFDEAVEEFLDVAMMKINLPVRWQNLVRKSLPHPSPLANYTHYLKKKLLEKKNFEEILETELVKF